MRTELYGTGVAVVTPFLKTKKIDFESLGRLIDTLIKGGVNYLLALGTTAETATLSLEEKKEIVRFFSDKIDGRVPFIVGVGANNINGLQKDLESLPLTKALAILSVTPYYNKPSQEGLYQYYKVLSTLSEKPILLYNVPGRTGVSIKPDTVARLADDCKNIIGIKEASTEIYHCLEMIRKVPENFLVISGNDALAVPLISSGMKGLISVCANAYPKEIATIVQASLHQKFDEIKYLDNFLAELNYLSFVENNPAGIKAFLYELGLCENELRLPLVPLSTVYHNQIKTWVARYKKEKS